MTAIAQFNSSCSETNSALDGSSAVLVTAGIAPGLAATRLTAAAAAAGSRVASSWWTLTVSCCMQLTVAGCRLEHDCQLAAHVLPISVHIRSTVLQ